MDLRIRNMVCNRCIRSVENIFHDLNIPDITVSLGRVITGTAINETAMALIKQKLVQEGFELLESKPVQEIEAIKNAIVVLVQNGNLDEMKDNLSAYLATELQKDYRYLSSLFSDYENTTIEQYFILQRIEKAKEWLAYNELSLKEIAFRLGYSSTAHLSSQFKQITGITATQFKNLHTHQRKNLDDI